MVYDHAIAKVLYKTSLYSLTAIKWCHHFLKHGEFKFPVLGNMTQLISGLFVTAKIFIVTITFLHPTWVPQQVCSN